MEVRILTLNLKGLESDWHGVRRPALVAGLKPLALDLVALQEVAIHTRPFYHQAQDLATALGMRAFAYAPYGNPAEVSSPEQGGVALLARWPLTLVENRRLPPGLRHPDNRVALLASVMAPDGPLHVAVTHLSWPPEEGAQRQAQLETILQRARDYGWLSPPARFLLAGDLNAPPDEPGIVALSSLLQDAWRVVHPDDPGPTWSHDNPLTGDYPLPSRRLDYLFVDPRATLESVRLLFDSPETGVVSDHYALMASVRWKEELPPREAREQ